MQDTTKEMLELARARLDDDENFSDDEKLIGGLYQALCAETGYTPDQPSLAVTMAQQIAISQQANYYNDPECPCAGLNSYRVFMADDIDDKPYPHKGAVAVNFEYIYEERDHPLGSETTIFAADGSVLESQDFG